MDANRWIASKASRRRARKTTSENLLLERLHESEILLQSGDKLKAKPKNRHDDDSSSFCLSPMWKNYDWARKQRLGSQRTLENAAGQDVSPGSSLYADNISLESSTEENYTNSVDKPHWQTVTTDNGRRRADTDRYKTEFCKTYRQQGRCRYGEKCLFAHGLAELRVRNRPYKYKTERCKSWWSLDASDNPACRCGYGDRCRFIHDETPEQLKEIRETRRANQMCEQTQNGHKNESLQKQRLSEKKERKKKPAGNRSGVRSEESLSDRLAKTSNSDVASVDSSAIYESVAVEPVSVGASQKEEDALLQDVWTTLLSSQENVREEGLIWPTADDGMAAEDCMCPSLTTEDTETHQRRLDIFGTLTRSELDEFSSCSFLDTSYSL